MPIDASIPLAYRAPQIDNPMNMLAQAMQIQGVQNQNALAQYSISRAKRQDDETNQLAQLMRQPGFDLTTPEGQRQAYSVAPTVTPTFIKSQLDQRKTVADTGKSTSEAGKFDADAASKRLDMIGQAFGAVRNQPDPQTANAAIDTLQQQGVFSPQVAAQHKQAIASDPTQIKRMADMYYTSALNAKDQLPQFQTRNTGALTQTLAINPVSGAVNVANSAQNTVSPDAQLQANTSRANNSANIAKDYRVAGMNPDGTPLMPQTADGKEEPWIVNAATRYNMTGALPTNLGRGAQGAQDIKRIQREAARQATDSGMTPEQLAVQQVTAKRALASFAPGGKDGQAVESANTALNHLDTLRQLAAAQNNGDIRLFNQIANTIAAQTGGAAPTNLQGAVTMVGPEISKAVIGVGGGQGDRDKVDAALAALTKGGPAQAAGTIATMQDLFGGRLTEKQRSYERGTGMKDFATTGGFLSPAAQKVLAARAGSTDPGTAPAGWSIQRVN